MGSWLKGNAGRVGLSAVGALALVCAAAPARAQQPSAQVLLLDDGAHPRPGLLASLRIQLADAAQVDARLQSAEQVAASVPARIHTAETIAAQEHVLLVVWSDSPVVAKDGSQEAVLYAVGQREGRALLEVVRVPGGEGPDMDRTLAIKVHEVVSELVASQKAALSSGMLAIETGDPNAHADSATQTDARALAPFADLRAGALVGTQAGTTLGQWGTQLAAGAGLGGAAFRASATLGIVIFPSLQVTRAAGQVRFSELSPELLITLGRRLDWLWLELQSGVLYSSISATGSTPTGVSASTHAQHASWLLGVQADAPIHAGFSLALGFDLQTRVVRQRFLVNGRELVDLGALRPLAHIALRFCGP